MSPNPILRTEPLYSSQSSISLTCFVLPSYGILHPKTNLLQMLTPMNLALMIFGPMHIRTIAKLVLSTFVGVTLAFPIYDVISYISPKSFHIKYDLRMLTWWTHDTLLWGAEVNGRESWQISMALAVMTVRIQKNIGLNFQLEIVDVSYLGCDIWW